MYRGLGNYDNSTFTVLGKLFELMALSVVWCICCIPVVTAGSACAALYYAVSKSVRRERGHALQEYFRAFKAELKTGVLLSLLLLAAALVLLADVYVGTILFRNPAARFLFYCIIGMAALFVLLMLPYLFPCVSRFTDTISGYLRKACLLSLRYFPLSLLLAALLLVAAYLVFLAPMLICVLPGFLCWFYSVIIDRIFKKFLLYEAEGTDTQDDRWYLE